MTVPRKDTHHSIEGPPGPQGSHLESLTFPTSAVLQWLTVGDGREATQAPAAAPMIGQ